MAISILDELEDVFQPRIDRMIDELAESIYETLNYFLEDCFTGWELHSYQMTQDFLRAAIKVDANTYKDSTKVSVYIDYEGINGYVNDTGYQIAAWTNADTYRGLSLKRKSYVWDNTMDAAINNDSLLDLAVQYLKDQGISVRE